MEDERKFSFPGLRNPGLNGSCFHQKAVHALDRLSRCLITLDIPLRNDLREYLTVGNFKMKCQYESF